MKKFLKVLLFSIMIIPICFEFNVFGEDHVEFLDTSNPENIFESSHWENAYNNWDKKNAFLSSSDKATGWGSAENKVKDEYIGYDFKKGEKIDFYEIEAVHDQYNLDNGYMPKSWELQGYIDGKWETIHTVTDAPNWTSTSEIRRYPVECKKEYSKFRILVKDTYDPLSVVIGRVRFGKNSNSSKAVLDIEPEKEKIKIGEQIVADLTIDNIKDIAAEDIKIKYDNTKLKFLGFEELDGYKLVKKIDISKTGDLRVILASKGEANIVNSKKVLLKLKFKGINKGDAIIDVVKGRVSDGIDMEKDLTNEQCDQGKIIIEGVNDVNKNGEFTLLDLAIDARHLNKNPKSKELDKYNTDILVNGKIDEDDLLEIGKLMLDNPNYEKISENSIPEKKA